MKGKGVKVSTFGAEEELVWVTVTLVDDRAHPGGSGLEDLQGWRFSIVRILGSKSDVGPEDRGKCIVPGMADEGEAGVVAEGEVF